MVIQMNQLGFLQAYEFSEIVWSLVPGGEQVLIYECWPRHLPSLSWGEGVKGMMPLKE
jgi:hypothetical protein